MFIVIVGEDWNAVMYDYMRTMGRWNALIFISLVVLGNWLLLNLFLAILLKNFEMSKSEEEKEDEFSKNSVSKWIASMKSKLKTLCSKCFKKNTVVSPDMEHRAVLNLQERQSVKMPRAKMASERENFSHIFGDETP